MRRATRFAFLHALLAPSAAVAHQGDHSGFDLDRLLGHLLEPDHLLLVVLVVLLGLLALRMARWARARAPERRKR